VDGKNLNFVGPRVGKIDLCEASKNTENYRSLLRYIMQEDPIVKIVFEKSTSNDQYFSRGIQKELLDTFGQLITAKITDQAKTVRFFTILADKIFDKSKQKNMPLGLQFLDSEPFQIRKGFLKFVSVGNLGSESVGQFVISRIKKLVSICNNAGDKDMKGLPT